MQVNSPVKFWRLCVSSLPSFLLHWCRVQARVAFSIGEAELYAQHTASARAQHATVFSCVLFFAQGLRSMLKVTAHCHHLICALPPREAQPIPRVTRGTEFDVFDGRVVTCRVLDSTACRGIMLRHGVGQLKHLATRTMWAQQIFQQALKFDGSHVP